MLILLYYLIPVLSLPFAPALASAFTFITLPKKLLNSTQYQSLSHTHASARMRVPYHANSKIMQTIKSCKNYKVNRKRWKILN